MKSSSRIVLTVIILAVAGIFVLKLFFIQLVSPEYKQLADRNALLRIDAYPGRGLIYDRNGKLWVYNIPEYNLYALNEDLKNFDSTKFCSLFSLSRETLRSLFATMKQRKEYSPRVPILFMTKLSAEDLAKAQDHLDLFPGISIQTRTSRAYAVQGAANAMGYVSEISKPQLDRDQSKYYKPGDYVGQNGLEAYYEKYLRGKKGVRFEWHDVRGVSKGAFHEGKYDTLSIPGQNIHTTIDLDLQLYGEKLMAGKIGSVVCIEPKTGEVLSFISAPEYDPNKLTGKEFSNYFNELQNDPNKPLFCRPLMAQYRPGSIFKIAQSLTALQEKVITPETRIPCNRTIINCHGAHTKEDLRGAVANSCNPYFHAVLRKMVNKEISRDPFEDTRIGLAEWRQYIMSLGFGRKLGIDLPNEKSGMVPSPEYYDRAYHSTQWKFSNIFSIAIGEGENLVVPLQMANFAAIIANKGYYYIPHLVKKIGNTGKPLPQFENKIWTKIDTANFTVVTNAMEDVVKYGTGSHRAKLDSIVVCGKTGTVQNKPPRKDHSVFIAFAPRNNPKIAVSVYVENAGEGARAAASIASLMIEKYLRGKTKRPYIEQYVLDGKFF